MTLRLLTLMSVVLLLSLAAFGLAMSHYQDQVMDEVARTASEVGRATLRTFEFQGPLEVMEAKTVTDLNEWRWQAAEAEPPVEETHVSHSEVDVRVQRLERPVIERSAHFVGVAEGAVGLATSAEGVSTISIVCDSEDEEITSEDCVETHATAAVFGAHNRFLIDIDGVHAEADPAEGLVLRIKTFKPEPSSEEGHFVVDEEVISPEAAETVVFRRHDDIRLPIPVKEYDSLFASVRKRSLWMFLGVFLVGTVLSAGLASRFTRPIRRLDAGIRSLSGGDLDVQVPTRGSDEIARLGRAFNDMTRSLRANRQRSREMVRREKHSALGRLAAGVAHDIRNPLHSIGLTLQHLQDTCRPESEQKTLEFDRSVDIIRGEIRRLDQLVGNFLRFAKSEVHERHRVDLRELLTETARLVRKEAEWRHVEVGLEIDESAPTVEADGEAIRSSILNLVLNSFEAMPGGGKLTLSLRGEEGEALLEVADTGEGIPREDQDRVFDFAYTTKEGGNGLGLAMVYQCIVEDHGGRLSLDSAPGGGTRVRLALPEGGEEVVS